MFVSVELLAKKRRELDAAEAAWLKDVAEYDRSGDWQIDKFQSAASALRHSCNLDDGTAHRYVTLARKLEKLPVVSQAFATGEISQRHAQVAADAFTTARAEHLEHCELQLVEQARSHPPNVFGRLLRRFTDAIDGDGGATADEIEFDRRACYTASTFNGAFNLRANGDQLSGEVITTALKAQMARDLQERDARSTAKRRFDALSAICRLHLEHVNTSETHGIRPHVSVVIDVDELPSEATTAATVPTEVPRHGFSAAMVELLTCDCEISRVITKGRSEVLDVGRATRTVSSALWKALVVRDRHCQAAGCNRPASDCDAHHINHWSHGGPTDLENLLLLCWHHHRERHIQEAKVRTRGGNRDP